MKTIGIPLLIATVLSGVSAQGWDFSYGYRSVVDANAGQYIVGQQTVRKYSEWYNSPPISYWAPSANDTAAALTMRFDFAAPTSEIFLTAQLFSANHGTDYGSCSLWGSTDGVAWQLLLNNPAPAYGGSQVYYRQDVPSSLLGSTSFWLQARMREHGCLTTAPDMTATWADAQFSRLDPANPGNVFQLNVLEVPEPGTWQLGLAGLLAWFGLRARRK